jgi:hypothetical protein
MEVPMRPQLQLVLLLTLPLSACDQHDQGKIVEDRTFEAWQALQRVDGKTESSTLPDLDFGNFQTIPPHVGRLRRIATGYSQIDLRDVDPILVDHLENSISVHVDMARALDAYYTDLAQLANQLQRDVDSARRFGDFLGGREGGQAGADIMEFLVRAGSDEDVREQIRGVLLDHEESLLAAAENFDETAARDCNEISA